VAFAASLLVHLLALVVLMIEGAPEYRLPTPAETPPIQVEIIPPLEIERPPPLPPIPKPIPKPIPQPIQVTPRATPQPQPRPATPQALQPLARAQAPAPPRPAVVKPVLIPSQAPPAPVVAKPAPSAVLNATPLPSLAPEPAPPAPARPPTASVPAAAPGPTAPRLNIHKSEKQAPAGTPTLNMSPSSSPPPAGGPRPTGGGEPAGGGGAGSRLQGLVPYPPGSLPNGGAGLRGSLVGCANSQAVGLSSVERAHCEQRFGSSAATAPHLDGIPPERRAAFDKEVEKQERDRAYRNSTTSSALTGLGGVSPDQTTTVIKLPK
jgi:hypothetical protein